MSSPHAAAREQRTLCVPTGKSQRKIGTSILHDAALQEYAGKEGIDLSDAYRRAISAGVRALGLVGSNITTTIGAAPSRVAA